jgi:hypothetical protein
MVERNEIDQMAQFMKALGNNPDALLEGRVAPESTSIAPPATFSRSFVGAEDIEEMSRYKNLVDGFVNGTNNVISDASIDRTLRESLITTKTARGAKIGNWEIVVKENRKNKTYDVIHTETSETIAVDLRLYEAARGLARALNDGKHINSKPVFEMLRLEQEYNNAVNDMVLYRHHLKKNPNSSRSGLYETKFEEAKYKAVYVREKLVNFTESM